MLFLFRVFLTGGFLWLLGELGRAGPASVDTDITQAGYFAAAVVVGLAAACTWAPLIGRAVADPITGMMTDGSVYSTKGGANRWILWAVERRHRRLALTLCFLQGVRTPHQPAPMVIGMEQARAGSWLEKIFAREVWRFSNVHHCLRAYDFLRYRHQEEPGSHPHSEINLALMARLREPRPALEPLAVPPAPPPPPLVRRPSIRLFRGAEKVRPSAEGSPKNR